MTVIPKYARRKDANQQAIVDALRAAGASVIVLHAPTDLLVGFHGVDYKIEIKDGSKPPSHRTKTEAQKRFFAEWRGSPAYEVFSIDDGLAVIGVRAWLTRYPGKRKTEGDEHG